MVYREVLSHQHGLARQRAVIEHIQWTRFAIFSSASLLFYDHLISLDMEVRLIWQQPWTLMKVLYLWLRYFGLIFIAVELVALIDDQAPNIVCAFWFKWETLGFSSLLITTEGVLFLWIYILHDKSLKVLLGIGCLYIAEMIAILFIIVDTFSAGAVEVHVGGGNVGFCFPQHPSRLFNAFWIPASVYHAVLLFMFFAVGYGVYAPATSGRREPSRQLAMIYKASLFNFVAIFLAYSACAIIWLGRDPSLVQIPVGFALTFCVTNCTRLLLNIRKAYRTFVAETQSGSIAIEVEIYTTQDFQFRSYGSEEAGEVDEVEVDIRTPLIQSEFPKEISQV